MVFSTADEAFSRIESFTNLEKSPNLTAREYRLDRMRKLAEIFGNPQNAFKSVHVAGSKGKGSTSAFVAAALSANGLKTGLYCSPHVETYRERISLAGKFFDDSLYAETASEMFSLISEKSSSGELPGGEPTTFELLTLLAFLIFRKAGCEWAVFETGLGGRLDATNIVTPEASILTIIELEHTEYLGNTIAKIAGEKAGIIKPGVPVFSAEQKPEAEEVFRRKAEESGSAIYFPPDLIEETRNLDPPEGFGRSCSISLGTGDSISLNLRSAGVHQVKNASLAASALSVIMPQGFDISAGMDEVMLPGRMERLNAVSKKGTVVPVILDGAHTVESVRSAADAFFETVGSTAVKEAVLIFGSVGGKDAAGMASVLGGRFGNIIISKPGTFKESSPKDVYSIFVSAGRENGLVRLIEDPVSALDAALETGAPVLVCGSFYMVAEIRPLLKKD